MTVPDWDDGYEPLPPEQALRLADAARAADGYPEVFSPVLDTGGGGGEPARNGHTVDLEVVADTGRRSVKDAVVALVEARCTIGQTKTGDAFIVPTEGPNVAYFKDQARGLMSAMRVDAGESVPSRSPLDDAWTAVEGRATMTEPQDLPIRVARHEGAVVVDLGDRTGRAVVVTGGGWVVVDRSPVTFRRSKALSPLPTPTVDAATRDELWALMNVKPGSRDIVWAWLLAALIQDMPHPILHVKGEQGSAKTTATRFLAALIDPSPVPTIGPPRDEESFQVTVNARWVPAFDNLSHIPEWLSDGLCRTVTGSGSLKRQHYSDNEVNVRVNRGAVVMNGITLSGALRSDLAERLLPLELDRPGRYMTERDLDVEWAELHPRILSALLGDLSRVLAAFGQVPAPTNHRMADFAHLLAVCDVALGMNTLDTYAGLREGADEEALEGDLVALCVLDLMGERDELTLPTGDLLGRLSRIRDALIEEGQVPRSGYWPQSAGMFSRGLTRSGPLLRRQGVEFERVHGHGGREIRLFRGVE